MSSRPTGPAGPAAHRSGHSPGHGARSACATGDSAPRPPLDELGQLRAGRPRGEHPDHRPGHVELLLEPLDAHGRVLARQAERLAHLSPLQLPGLLQPPQRQQFPLVLVQPARRLRHLPPVAVELQPQHGEGREVGRGIGELGGQFDGFAALPVLCAAPYPVPYLPHGDGHHPRSVRRGVLQPVQAAHHAQQRLLYDVVDVLAPAQRTADDVVDQRQGLRHQPLDGPRIARTGGGHQPGAGIAPVVCTHEPSLPRPASAGHSYWPTVGDVGRRGEQQKFAHGPAVVHRGARRRARGAKMEAFIGL